MGQGRSQNAGSTRAIFRRAVHTVRGKADCFTFFYFPAFQESECKGEEALKDSRTGSTGSLYQLSHPVLSGSQTSPAKREKKVLKKTHYNATSVCV